MTLHDIRTGLAGTLLISSTLLLSACGGSDNDTAATTTSVSGTAATGAPIVDGTVALRCMNAWTGSASTGSNGSWTVQVPTANLPCAVRLSGGTGNTQDLYSLVTGSGASITSNLTPLTSLALAKATGAPLDSTWFNALNSAGVQELSSLIANAISQLIAAMQSAGYTLPANFNPLTQTFSPVNGNAYDDLLEALKAALTDAGTDLDTALANFASGAALPTATSTSTCTAGDDKLLFSNNPSDFCGFTLEATSNSIPNYYQFTSTSAGNGTTYVKFNLDAGDTAVQSLMIENDKYAFQCGGALPACSGITVNKGSSYIWFDVSSTELTAITGTTQNLTATGMLTHFFPAP